MSIAACHTTMSHEVVVEACARDSTETTNYESSMNEQTHDMNELKNNDNERTNKQNKHKPTTNEQTKNKTNENESFIQH